MNLGAVVIVVVALALLVAAVLLLRSRRVSPWPAIVVATMASGISFTVGGDASKEGSGPSVATVVAAVVGLLTVVAAVLSLIRRPEGAPLSRIPTLLAVTAIVIGAVGLIVYVLTS